MLGLSRPAPGHTKCTVYGDVPYAPGPTRAAVTSLNSTIRVWPERHQAQSCAIALSLLSYLLSLYLRPPASDPLSTYLIPPPHCIWIGHRSTMLYLDAHPNTTTVVGHTLAIQRNRRASGIAYSASTTLPRIQSIGKITSLRVCVDTGAAIRRPQ